MIPDLNQQIDRLLDLAFDFVCERPISDFVSPEDIVQALDQAAQPTRVARIIERLVAPGRERLLALGRASQLKLGAWIPAPTQEILAELLGRPVRLPRDKVEAVVASEKVRESVKRMLEEAFTTVLEKAFAAPTASTGRPGVRNLLGLGARTAAAAGKGMFDALTGGIGEGIKEQLATRLRDFVDLGVQLVQQRLVERLTADDTAQLLGKQRRQFFLDTLERSEAEVARSAGATPFALVDGLLPVVVEHNLQRQEVRAAIVQEIEANLTELSKQNVGGLLDELGLRDQARELLRQRARPLIQKFVADPRFGAWLASVFAPRPVG